MASTDFHVDSIYIGAEVFIEPGQTRDYIRSLFRTMQENHFHVTRIRMFENYMRDDKGDWDFSLFDWAFEAGEEYGIHIYANLFPATRFDDVGGFKFPRTKEHLAGIADYIRHVVGHFKRFGSLCGWVPVNEPGVTGVLPKEPFTEDAASRWKEEQKDQTYDSNGYVHFDFAKERFLLDYNTWFLRWLADEIRQYDDSRAVHVNNHDIFRNAAEYDFHAWSGFLSSLGGSAHASWHFGYFAREQYALAVDANSEIIRSGANGIPWFMTELQGGNNVYSGRDPMCPTPEEITQWLWITTATESKGCIFWCLNPRASGLEAGEWAMLDYQSRPTDRLQAASAVSASISAHTARFSEVQTVESGVHLLYIRESLWIESKLLGNVAESTYEARMPGAVMKSVLAYQEALSHIGVQVSINEIGEFGFDKTAYRGIVVVLAHQVAIPSRYWEPLHEFVRKGGKLIVEGLTAYYDEHAVCIMQTGFPFSDLFGAVIREFKFVGQLFSVALNDLESQLPAHALQGQIRPSAASILGGEADTVTAVRNQYGAGEVLWVPSLLGMGARIANDCEPLSTFLQSVLPLDNVIRFSGYYPKVFMKTFRSNGLLTSVLISKNEIVQEVSIQGMDPKAKGDILFANKSGSVAKQTVRIFPEETVVVAWE